MLDVEHLNPPPTGFPGCRLCPYRDVGSAAICYACASRVLSPLADDRCDTCDLELKTDGECGNPVCGWPEGDRGFRYVYAIAMMEGPVQKVIYRYKYDGVKEWAEILGRIVAAELDEYPGSYGRFDLIVPSPTYVGDGGRPWDHTQEILRVAAAESARPWPIVLEPQVVVQTLPVERFVEQKSWKARLALAEGPLRAALEVPDPSLVRGQAVLVFDDVFTDGLRTREVARVVRQAGATEVSQLVLARQPFRPALTSQEMEITEIEPVHPRRGYRSGVGGEGPHPAC